MIDYCGVIDCRTCANIIRCAGNMRKWTDSETGEEFQSCGENRDEPHEEEFTGKPLPKEYHCRICGTIYYDKALVKRCEREHDWQNRKARR